MNAKRCGWLSTGCVNAQHPPRKLVLSALNGNGVNRRRWRWCRCCSWCGCGRWSDIPYLHDKGIIVIIDAASVVHLERIGGGEIGRRGIAGYIGVSEIPDGDASSLVT